MQTLQTIQSTLALLSYKPGWRIEAFDNTAGSIFLQVKFEAVDPNERTVGVQGGRKWLLSPHMTEGEIVQTAFLAILTAEQHEAREFFLYEGAAIFGPHFCVRKLKEFCEAAGATELREGSGSKGYIQGTGEDPRCSATDGGIVRID